MQSLEWKHFVKIRECYLHMLVQINQTKCMHHCRTLPLLLFLNWESDINISYFPTNSSRTCLNLDSTKELIESEKELYSSFFHNAGGVWKAISWNQWRGESLLSHFSFSARPSESSVQVARTVLTAEQLVDNSLQ